MKSHHGDKGFGAADIAIDLMEHISWLPKVTYEDRLSKSDLPYRPWKTNKDIGMACAKS